VLQTWEEVSVPKILKLRLIFLVVFCLPGMAIVGFAMNLAANAMALTRSGMLQEGVIVKYERPSYRSRKPRLGSPLCATVQFQHAGESHSFEDEWCSRSPKTYPIGSSVSVVFNPDAPSEARINRFWELYGSSLMSALIGTPWLLLGMALVIRVR
jgi:hypothetical protein